MNNTIDHIISLSPGSKGLISLLYNSINNIVALSLQHVRSRWENDIGEEMADDQWQKVLDLILTSSPCARHRLIQLKTFLRVHFTKARLAKLFPDLDPSCPRCNSQPADHIHMFWSCPNLSSFWGNILIAYSSNHLPILLDR